MLKKIFLLIFCTNLVMAAPQEATKKNIVTEFTERQIVALRAIRFFDAFAGGVGMASGVVVTLPEGTPRIIKATIFVPVALLIGMIGFQRWEDCGMEGIYKRHKWLLLGL